MILVKKRNGEIVSFDKNKIEISIGKAFLEVDGLTNEEKTVKIAEDIQKIAKTYSENEPITVEEIQDYIEKLLTVNNCYDVSKSYIRYRYLHEMARKGYNELWKAISEKIEATDVQNQNANVDEQSFGGRIGETSDLVLKKYALDFCMSEKSKKNHINNRIYVHDLAHYAVGDPNCLTIPIDKLAKDGAIVRGSRVLRRCGSFVSFGQLSAVWMQLQSLNQFGGVSYGHYDWSAVPYVRKSFFKHYKDGVKYLEGWDELDYSFHCDLPIDAEDYKAYSPAAYKYAMDMTEREVYQTIEALYHNLNTLQSRSGNQLPFSSINYGTCTLLEGRMVTKAILDNLYAGIGALHTTSIFPCGIFQCMNGVNEHFGEPNYDLFQLALKCTAKRLYPNYANVDWSGNAGYDRNDPRTYFSTMGCRTANGWDINHDEGVNGQLKDGRGNICPVTIIMPTLAMEAVTLKDNDNWEEAKKLTQDERTNIGIERFLILLDDAIHDAKDMLIERFEWICSQPPESAKFVYQNGLLEGYIPEEGIRSALKHGTLAVGQLGLAETLQILIGQDHTSAEGMKLAKRIEGLFKKRCAEFKEEYKLNFGVYMTPAENLCYTAMKKFREKYGIIANISDREYFTNSIHVPVWKKISPLEKIYIESQLTGYSSAGCITYVECDSSVKHNLKALEKIVLYAMEHDIPYFAINIPNDQCTECGYCDEINDSCPECGNTNIRRLRRVTGYLTGDYKQAFNKGKQQEAEQREKHNQIEIEVC